MFALQGHPPAFRGICLPRTGLSFQSAGRVFRFYWIFASACISLWRMPESAAVPSYPVTSGAGHSHLHSVPTPVASMELLSKIFPALGLLPVWLLLPGCPCQMLAPMLPAHLPDLHLKQSPPTQPHVTCLSNTLHDTIAGRACPAG